ncbi:MAG: hypothetical protein M1484_02420 [Patescibacteria group bacterium]|nr:hypothetical protein [Patescibacteria group bacterium]MCL5431935.1 hypothetical protein [Patescibacteria group bacterium]
MPVPEKKGASGTGKGVDILQRSTEGKIRNYFREHIPGYAEAERKVMEEQKRLLEILASRG